MLGVAIGRLGPAHLALRAPVELGRGQLTHLLLRAHLLHLKAGVEVEVHPGVHWLARGRGRSEGGALGRHLGAEGQRVSVQRIQLRLKKR